MNAAHPAKLTADVILRFANGDEAHVGTIEVEVPVAVEVSGGVTHQCPRDGDSLTPCCGRTPFELPRTDRLTADVEAVTCQ